MHEGRNIQQANKKNYRTNFILVEKAGESVQILVKEIAEIRSVKQWAESCYVSRSCLKKRMNKVFGRYPKSILREVRFEFICLLISEKGAMAASINIAIESGLGNSSDALYKFLTRNFDTTFSELKHNILTGNLPIPLEWLNNFDQQEELIQLPNVSIDIPKVPKKATR